jgi:hypothetical protein
MGDKRFLSLPENLRAISELVNDEQIRPRFGPSLEIDPIAKRFQERRLELPIK